jgi:poly(3-hydroxybutyrate) depolymerase
LKHRVHHLLGAKPALIACGVTLLIYCLVQDSVAAAEVSHVSVATSSSHNPKVDFHYRVPHTQPTRATNRTPLVLLLIPGYNGDGRDMLNDTGWARFADKEHLILVAPTFKTTPQELDKRQGYYYPELWSGKATTTALQQIQSRVDADTSKILLFGFSAGAHFVHRFANWNPERIRAFVACSAGWWDSPLPRLRTVPALIMCGERDLRFGPTHEFMQKGQSLRLPWIWRGYAQVDHQITPPVQRMAEAFLAHYARNQPAEPWAGDLQTYEVFPTGSAEAEAIPPELRVLLPSKEMAEVWRQEL